MKNTIGFNLHSTKTLRYRIKNNKTLIFKSRMNYNTGITINDYPLINSDVVDKLTFLRNKGFTQYKFIGGNNSTAFNTPINKGDEVDIVINENSAYDKNFEYGAIIGSSIKTADEIFAPDQDGNYDISDYPAIPATTLLERIGTFPTGSNNTIRINKDTAAKYVEGFRTENLLNENYFNFTLNSVDIIYNNGTIMLNGTASSAFYRTNTVWAFNDIILEKGIYILSINEPINVIGVALYVTNMNKTNTPVIGYISSNNTTSTVIIDENLTKVRIGFNVPLNTTINKTIIINLIKSNNNYIIHPIEKLDYVVAQANAKGYDVTIANNENDVKLIEKVEFDGTKYIDTGIDINGVKVSEITVEADIIITKFDNSMGLLTATTIDSTNSVCLFVTKTNDGNYYLYSSGKELKRSYAPQITIQDMLNKRNLYGLKNCLLTFNRNNDSNTCPNYTIDADNTTKIGCRQVILNNRNPLFGNIFSVTLNDNLFVPAYNSANGMINLKDMSFHPLIAFN